MVDLDSGHSIIKESTSETSSTPKESFVAKYYLIASDCFSTASGWHAGLSIALLLLASVLVLPLYARIFKVLCGRKKLWSLVKALLFSHCLLHILLLVIGVPTQVWAILVNPAHDPDGHWFPFLVSQQVVTNFVNLSGLCFTTSIAVLQYRQAVLRKIDKLSWPRALKMVVATLTIPSAIVLLPTMIIYFSASETSAIIPPVAPLVLKIALELILFCVTTFCYYRVITSLSPGTAEGTWLTEKRRNMQRSRYAHVRATSCCQVILIFTTMIPYWYEEVLKVYNYHQHLDKPPQIMTNGRPIYSSSEESMHFWSNLRLWGITLNYLLLILGSPIACFSSCYEYRESCSEVCRKMMRLDHSTPVAEIHPPITDSENQSTQESTASPEEGSPTALAHRNESTEKVPKTNYRYSLTVAQMRGAPWSSSPTKSSSSSASSTYNQASRENKKILTKTSRQH